MSSWDGRSLPTRARSRKPSRKSKKKTTGNRGAIAHHHRIRSNKSTATVFLWGCPRTPWVPEWVLAGFVTFAVVFLDGSWHRPWVFLFHISYDFRVLTACPCHFLFGLTKNKPIRGECHIWYSMPIVSHGFTFVSIRLVVSSWPRLLNKDEIIRALWSSDDFSESDDDSATQISTLL